MKNNRTINVGGEDIPWDVRTLDGIFTAQYRDQEFTADSLKKLTDKLRAAAKAQPLNIPYVKYGTSWRDDDDDDGEDLEITRGKVISIHSGNGNFFLMDDNDEKPYQHCNRGLLRGDTDVDKLRALYEAKEAAEKAWREFIDANELEIPKGDA